MNLKPQNVLLWAAVPVAVYLGFQALRAARNVVKGTETATSSLGSWINERAHDQNIFSATANAITELVTLDPHATLGGAIFDLTHPQQAQQ